MGEHDEPMQLRPLSIGEIFDRAVTLLVRNWAPLLIIAAITTVPSNLCNYLAVVSSPAWGFAGTLLLLLMPVGTMATAGVVAQRYRREPVKWHSAFGAAFSRILSAFGVNATLMLIALLPLLIIVGIPSGLGVFKLANPLEDAVAVLVIVAGGAIFVGAAFAGLFALNAMAIDEYRAMDSIGRALEIFGPARLGRTMIFAVALCTVLFGGAFAGGFLAGFLGGLVHNPAIGAAIEAVLILLTNALTNLATSVFYFDVAIRSEGYDLQAALDGMPS